MIVFSDISVVFNRGGALETSALRGIDLQVAAGEFITVIAAKSAVTKFKSDARKPKAHIGIQRQSLRQNDIPQSPPNMPIA